MFSSARSVWPATPALVLLFVFFLYPVVRMLGFSVEAGTFDWYAKALGEGLYLNVFWTTLQIAWSGVVKPGKTLRMPTFAQERFMAYQAIVNGARGLVFFGGHIPAAWTASDAELGWNWSFWEKVLRPVVEEIGDKGPLAEALVAEDSKLAVRVKAAEGIEYRVREVGRDVSGSSVGGK